MSNSVIDIHGNLYNTIQIDDQEWMTENLRVKQNTIMEIQLK